MNESDEKKRWNWLVCGWFHMVSYTAGPANNAKIGNMTFFSGMSVWHYRELLEVHLCVLQAHCGITENLGHWEPMIDYLWAFDSS